MAEEADPELSAMARADLARLPALIEPIEAGLHELLLPRDPLDDRDAIVEIRAGTGGDEGRAVRGGPLPHVPALRPAQGTDCRSDLAQ